MNVDDFKDVVIPEGDMLELIFNHQRDLLDKYHLIEEELVGHPIPSAPYTQKGVEDLPRHWFYAGPLQIQDRASQLRFKSFAWRITEELTEATLSLGEENDTHYLEELIDALHFSVELLIMAGLFPCPDQKRIGDPAGDRLKVAFSCSHEASEQRQLYTNHDLKVMTYWVIEKLGEAMNRCKLKEWKRTAMQTDERAFHQSLSEFFAKLIDLLKASGFTAETCTKMYMSKNLVNKFRIGSGY
jgi:hypothetical protein